MRVELSIGAGAVAVFVGAAVLGGSAPATAEQRFELSFPASVHGEPVTGRIYVMVSRTRQWMKTTENPHYEGFFMYGDGKGHCFRGPVTRAERLREMAQHIMRKKPDGVTTPWWQY